MSSAGATTPVGPTAPKPYFCYQCERTVSISISPSSELLCPFCHGGFLEEYENPNPNPNPINHPLFSDPFSSPFGFPLVFSSSSSSPDLQQSPFDDLSALFGTARRSSAADPDAFNPILFLQNYLHTLTAGGANVQFVIENSSDPSSAAFRLPTNFGDYFLGPGLEQLIQQLAENDPNRYGTPPASKKVVDSLPNIKVSDELLASDSSQCAVCMDTFELGVEAKQIPCKHIYHPGCILPWLELHNSCPVCRFELPTDDPDYEQRMRETPTPANQAAGNAALGLGGGGTGEGDSGAMQTAERRLRISLPWPFRAFGAPAETSNSGFGSHNDDSSNDGDRNSNSGNRGRGPETRQEDLD